jgi:hypothetical protein
MTCTDKPDTATTATASASLPKKLARYAATFGLGIALAAGVAFGTGAVHTSMAAQSGVTVASASPNTLGGPGVL